jgi:hypothetical protein
MSGYHTTPLKNAVQASLAVGQAETPSQRSNATSSLTQGSAANARGKTTNRKGAAQKSRPFMPVYVFFIALFIPWVFNVGGAALTVYRLVLLGLTVPCLVMWLSGRAGRIRLADIGFFLFVSWCSLSFIAVDGVSASIQPIGIHFVETMCPYLLARCYIRNAEDFHKMVAFAFAAVAALLPFALIEAIARWNIAHDLFAAVMPSHPNFDMPPRWGMKRVQAVFEHPILFGVSTGGIFALVHIVLGYQQSAARRWLRSGIVALTAFLSLSAGPMAALLLQILLLSWNWLMGTFKARWKVLWCLFALVYVLVAVGSNQSVPAFFIGHFSFDDESSYFRVLIWNFGSQSVMNHPLFGVAFGEWDRPEWMPPSIDMFWLIYAVRHGLPAGILLFFAFASACLAVAFKRGLDERQDAYRLAYLVTMAGFFLVGWTVYFWNATYVLFMFLVGSGMWLLDVESDRSKPKRRSHALASAEPTVGKTRKVSTRPE